MVNMFMYGERGRTRGRGGRRGGPSGFGGGFRARRGGVRAAILALLVERPMHGYEMINELKSRSHGHWFPSAGSIYPRLQMLEDEDLVTSEQVDGKRRYSLTEEGRAEAEQRQSRQMPWEQVAEAADTAAGRLHEATSQVSAAATQAARVGSDDQIARVHALLAETRRRIYAILAEDV